MNELEHHQSWIQINGSEMTDEINVQELSDFELSDKYSDTFQELLKVGEAMHQTTQEGRDLQSLRAALLIELSRRGLR